jgi:gliding motility-associated-like protein
MKRHIFFLGYFIFLVGSLNGQTNLTFNPSFEDTVCCPESYYMIECSLHWYQPNPSIDPFHMFSTNSSTDYYHPCNSSQYPPYMPSYLSRGFPRSGGAFSGLLFSYPNHPNYSSYREYLCGSLKKPLLKNHYYYIQIYVLPLVFSSGVAAAGDIGVYFSKDSILNSTTSFNLLPEIPQYKSSSIIACDTMNWTRIKGSFIALGGEMHFAIGNFEDDQHTILQNCRNPGTTPFSPAYYYIDDVSVWPCDAPVYEADAGNDNHICFGDEITLGQNLPDDEYRFLWSLQSHQLTQKDHWDTLSTTPYLTVKPAKTTTYYMWVRDFKMDITYDSVTVYVDPCMTLPEIPNVFTPNGDGFNDLFTFKNHEGWELETCIRNRWGQVVFEGRNDHWWDGTIHGQPAAAGVYYYTVTASNHFGQHETFQGVVTVLR